VAISDARSRLDSVHGELSQVRSALTAASRAATAALGDPTVQDCAAAARCLARVATALAGMPGAVAELRLELRLADAYLSRPPDGPERVDSPVADRRCDEAGSGG
jgi:hypothetical protein